MIKQQDIICFSFSDWASELVSNRYHMLTRFAKDNRVFLFERPVLFENYDKHRWRFFLKPVRSANNIKIITPIGGYDERRNRNIYRFYLKQIFAYFEIRNPIFWFYNYNLSYIIDEFPHLLSCYHCTEDYPALSKISSSIDVEEQVKRIETEFVNKINIVFSVSEAIHERLQKVNARAYLTQNAVDYNLYSLAQQPAHKKVKQKVLGYAGNISSKINFDLLIVLAETFQDCKIILIGPIINPGPEFEKLKTLKNVEFVGKIDFNLLPQHYRYFDVCLIPYIQDEWFVKAAQPLKLFEYMASGKPIVSTKMDCLENLQDVVYESKTIPEFVDNVKIALKEKNHQIRSKRIQLAKKNTWDHRFSYINQKIEEFLKKKHQDV